MIFGLNRWPRLGLVAALAAASLAAGVRPQPPARPLQVTATAPLGTVVTASLDIDNRGLPASTASLYEALAPAAGQAQADPPTELRVPLPDDPGPITPELAAAFSASPGSQTEFIIYLADQADLGAAAAIHDWNARGAAVVETLRAHATQSQAGLVSELRAAGFAPATYWIVNAVSVVGDERLAQWAAKRPEVALVAANSVHKLEEGTPPAEAAAMGVSDSDVAWGVSQIGAPAVWADWGVRGSGIVVANIDTGVAYTHSALLGSYRGSGPGGIDHNYNWFDAAAAPPALEPLDAAGHGTHTMGTIVGSAAGTYTALGVAPAAHWIAARGCSSLFCTDTALFSSAQWLLAPTNLAGNSPRPDLRPHVINNSWSKPGEDNWYVGYVQAWNASGIFSVFANGNLGVTGGCGSSGSPGQYAEAFAAGATDAGDVIANFSSRGPTSDNRIKPDISAPGVAVPSAWPDGGVSLLSGTSMAAPHVAGVVALLWSANPALVGDLPATRAALTSTAVPRTSAECGPSPNAVPNNVYGWGRLDARQAVRSARVDLPWLTVPVTASLAADSVSQVTITLDARQVSEPGLYEARVLVMRDNTLTSLPVSFEVQAAANTALVSGRLEDRWTGGGVYGRVQVDQGMSLYTDAGGQFTMTLPYGDYDLTGAASGYLSVTQPVSVTGPAVANFSLMPDRPHLVFEAALPISATLAFAERFTGTLTLSNNGTQPLSITASIPLLEWVTDAAGVPGAVLHDLGSAPSLSLDDDQVTGEPLALGFQLPIYGQLVSQIYVSSNGWISVQQPASAAPFATCMTGASMPYGTLAAFWADLDPSAGGAVRAAQVDADTFVVSYEDIPVWQETPDPEAPTYSFQIVLHSDGAVDFLFGAMGAMPGRWSMGTYYSSTRLQSLACYQTPVALAKRRWTLHNQPPTTPWLTTPFTAASLAPGESVTVPVVMRGFGSAAWATRPFEGYVRLTTNDPTQPWVDATAVAVILPPEGTVLYYPIMWP